MLKNNAIAVIALLIFVSILNAQEWWQQAPPAQRGNFAYQYNGNAGGSQYSALANFQHQFMEFEAEASVDMTEMKNDVQAEIMAQSAAELRAYAQAAKFITGLLIQGVYSERMAVAEKEVVAGKLKKTIVKHARVIDKSVHWDRGAPRGKVKIGILFRNQGGIIEMAIPVWQEQAKQYGITPYKPVTDNVPSREKYTGLIIVAKGLQIIPSISPLILSLDGKKEIYGTMTIEPKYAVEKGIIGYHKTLDSAKKDTRIGNNPLIIKAQKGFINNHSVGVSNNDAAKIFLSDLNAHFLAECSVIFVGD